MCGESFTRKDYMTKHRERAHRTRYGDNPPVYTPLDTIPADITEVKIKNLYFIEKRIKKVPPGYDPALLPLAKVTYFQGLGPTPPLMVSYNELRERFPRDINKFFMARTILVPKQ